MAMTSPATSPDQPEPADIPYYQPPAPISYMPGATPPVSPAPGYGPPYVQQPWPYQGPPVVAGHAAKRAGRGTVLVVVAGLIALALVGGILTVVFGPPSLVRRTVPIGKDTGVAACEALRDKTVVSHAQAGESKADGWARARKLFADSRYGDLRDAGTKLVDLMAQYDGLSSDGNALGAGLFMGSQIIQAYGTLSGACSAHGVNIPALGTY